ncbi:MAG: hypothetical protein ACOY42_02950 [Pseudomonadota bacterium]
MQFDLQANRPLPWSATNFRKPSTSRLILLVGFLLPLALDVKKMGEEGGSALQTLLVAVSLLCGAVYFFAEWLSRDIRSSSSALRTMTALWWTYIALSPLPVLFWGVDPIHYLKVLLPYVLFGAGLSVMVAVERRRIDPAYLVDILLWACLLSTLWRVLYAIASGLSIELIRWQILGPGVPFLIGYGVGGLYLRRRRTLSAIALSIGLAVVLLAITRSYVISAAFVLAGLLIVDSRRRSALRAAKTGARLFVSLAAITTIAFVLTGAVRPDFLEAWFGRLFQHQAEGGLDITLITRLAEFKGQIEGFTRNPGTFIFGNGIGADYTWDAQLLRQLPFQHEHDTRWFAGHSTWVYPFFAGGLFFGLLIPLLVLGGLLRAFTAASISATKYGSRDAVLVWTVYLAYVGQSFTANLFHERYTGVILGVLIGASLIYAGRVREARVSEQRQILQSYNERFVDGDKA